MEAETLISEGAQLCLAVACPLAAGALCGHLWCTPEAGRWYLQRVRKPPWALETSSTLLWAGWAVLSTCEGTASWLVWRQGAWAEALPLCLYALTMALALAWVPLFFRLRLAVWSLVDASVLLSLQCLTILTFAHVSGAPLAIALLSPLLATACYSWALTWAVLSRNSGRRLLLDAGDDQTGSPGTPLHGSPFYASPLAIV